VVIRLTPRFLSDDMVGLKQAAIAGLGIAALDQEHSGAYCPLGLLVIPRSRLSFPTGGAFCPPSAFYRKRS